MKSTLLLLTSIGSILVLAPGSFAQSPLSNLDSELQIITESTARLSPARLPNDSPARTLAEWHAQETQATPAIAQVIQVQVSRTDTGLDITLDTKDNQPLRVDTKEFKVEGNALVAQLSNAVLALPNGQPFESNDPAEGITVVRVTQVNETTVEIRVVGQDQPPPLEVTLKIGGLAYSLNPDDVTNEEEITITGTRNARPVRLTPGSITVIEDQDIDESLSRDLRDLLIYEPNVSVGNTRRYGLQDIVIRGLGGNRVLIQNDGIRLPTQFQFGTPSYGRDYIDLETLQRAEIIRGPASALYGSDALGGVVSFKTLDPADLLDRYGRDTIITSLSTNIETADTSFLNTGTTAFRVGQFEALLSYTRRDGAEATVPNGNAFVDDLATQRNNVLGKFVYRLDDRSRIGLTVEVFRNNSEVTVAPITAAALLAPTGFRGQGETVDFNTSRDRVSFSYNFDNPSSTGILSAARVQIYFQNAEIDEFRFQDFVRTGAGRDQRRIRNLENTFLDRVIGGDFQLLSRFKLANVQNQLTYGVDVSNTRNERIRDGIETRLDAAGNVISTSNVIGADSFPVKDFPDSDTLRLGFYLQDEIQIGKSVTLIPGARFDIYKLSTDPDELYANNPGATAADFSDSALSPSLGLVWQATPEISVVARYARGFRAPLYSEINAGFTNLTNPFFRYQTLSNPNLRPETSDTFELGLRGNFRQTTFSATAFYNDYDNFIETFAPAGVSFTIVPGVPVNLFQSQNIGRARTYGFELSGEHRFSSQPHGFSLLASLGLTVGDDLTENQPLESIDPFKAVIGLRYRAPKNKGGAALLTTFVTGPRLRDDRPDNAYTPSGYTVVDLIGHYNITPLLTINAGLFNILNTQYFLYQDVRTLVNTAPPADLARFAQPGISFRAGLTWRF
jgi:hemoglobin/transferrin/lactoferrin receptor protein